MYSRSNGWKAQFVGDNGFTFETGFIFNEIRWVFQSQSGSSILVSEYFENGFDRINDWSIVDSNFATRDNACVISCSASGSPTATPSKSPVTETPTKDPVTSIPTNVPSIAPSAMPTDAPVTAEPTNLPSVAPSASSPTQSPSVAPTRPCLAFTLECSSNLFDGVYSYDAWQRAWIEESTGDEFSVTIFPTGLKWVFESRTNSALLISSSYDHDFSSISQWAISDRDLTQSESTECSFECSASFYPSVSPSVSTTLEPSQTPVTSAPTMKQKHIFFVENHIIGRSALNSFERSGWVNAMTNVLNGPNEVNIISITSMVPIQGIFRRNLGNPDLNVTAEVVFYSEDARDAQMSTLSDDSQQANLNTVLGIMFMMNGLAGVQSEFVGLLGSFDGAYYQPTNMPTEMPSIYKAKSTFAPTLMPTVATGTVITVVIDDVDPNDPDLGDEIKEVTDDVTGDDTTVVSIEENPDGTVTVTVNCATCDSTDNEQVADDVNNGLSNLNVVSVTSTEGGAKNGGGEMAVAEVATSGTTWMMIALIVAASLVAYVSYINRQSLKNCVLCKRKEEIIEVPQGFDFEIAQPHMLPHGLVRGDSVSSAWTAYTAQTAATVAQEGDETGFSDFEGNETIDVVPANVVQDGWEETGMDDDDISETADGDFAHTGGEFINDAYSRPCLDMKNSNDYNGEGYQLDSPTAIAYETDIDSPTAVSVAPSSKRGPRSIDVTPSNASTPTAYNFQQFASQDLSGFAAFSPSASASRRFFPAKDPSLQTEQLERDWAARSQLKNDKRTLQSFSTRSLGLNNSEVQEFHF